MMRREEVLQGVSECLSIVLDIPATSVREEVRLVGDLGADSLDLLDLSFQLEQRFRIRVTPRDIERRTRERLGGGPLDVDGIYTPEALAEFRRAMPEVPQEELAPGLTVTDLPRRFRVATIVNLVLQLLQEQRAGDTEGDADG